MRVVVLASSEKYHIRQAVEKLRPLIAKYADIVGEDITGQAELDWQSADYAIVLGGDGSILRAARQMGQFQLPVIAVNLGRLGFLAEISPDQLEQVLNHVATGNVTFTEHLMLQCSVLHEGRIIAEEIGLNEVTVQTGPPFSLMELDLYVDEEWVTTYSCDGLIVSTPVGSTAHNLSAGGPILRKDLQAVVISPISPHTLSNRPVVDAAWRKYEIVVAHAVGSPAAVLDGVVLAWLQPGDRVRVRQADVKFKMVTPPGHSYYRTLREKLGWGGRMQSVENNDKQ